MASAYATDTRSSPALTAEHLTKTYRPGLFGLRQYALRELSMSVSRGGITALLGPNGSGKTTLIKIITGLARPDSGGFRVLGSPLTRAVKARIGYVPDKPHPHGFLTPWESLSFYADMAGIAAGQKKGRMAAALESVGMADKAHARQKSFSKGMLQRVALAQALLNDPELLILDEPLGALDPWGVRLLRGIFQRMREAGKTVLFSSHLLAYAQDLADAYVLLHRGVVLRCGSMQSGLNLEEMLIAAIPQGEQGA